MTSILASQSAMRSSYSYSQNHYGGDSSDVDDSDFSTPEQFADAVKDTNHKNHAKAISVIAHADEPVKKSFFERIKDSLGLD